MRAELVLYEPSHEPRNQVGSTVEWLKHRINDQHGHGSKPTCAILLCP